MRFGIMIKRIIQWFRRLFRRQADEPAPVVTIQSVEQPEPEPAPKPRRRRARSEPRETFWPAHRVKVDMWERCWRDMRVDWRGTNLGDGRNAAAVVKHIRDHIGPMGCVECTDDAEVRESRLYDYRYDGTALPTGHISYTNIADRDSGSIHENMFNYGIVTILAAPDSDVGRGCLVKDPGQLWTVHYCHWSADRGHMVAAFQIIFGDDGAMHPLWRWDVRNKTYSTGARGEFGRRLHRTQSIPVLRKAGWADEIVGMVGACLVFQQQRDAFFIATVKSDGVPPLAFPIPEWDIARVFPPRQRDGDGRIVHWAKSHWRTTEKGVIPVKTHLRGRPQWWVDGRSVRVTMPGKHHATASDLQTVIAAKAPAKIVRDPITGLCYQAERENSFLRLLQMSLYDKIDIDTKDVA